MSMAIELPGKMIIIIIFIAVMIIFIIWLATSQMNPAADWLSDISLR